MSDWPKYKTLIVNIALWRSELLFAFGRGQGWALRAPGAWILSLGWVSVSWWPGRYVWRQFTAYVARPSQLAD